MIHFFSSKKEKNPEKEASSFLLQYEVANLQGIGARERQEDAFTFVNVLNDRKIKKEGMLFVVADGMGGMADGKLASETVINSLRDSFRVIDRQEDIAVQLRESVFKAGERVYQAIGGGGGSTVVACMAYNDQLYFASVGDSFLYLYRNGQLFRLNREHNLMNEIYLDCIRAGEMNLENISPSDEGQALTQFLGMDGMDDVDFLRTGLPLCPEDILLVCSDGVGGVLSQQVLLSCLSSGKPETICQSMEREIISQGRLNQDNYTALVIQCR